MFQKNGVRQEILELRRADDAQGNSALDAEDGARALGADALLGHLGTAIDNFGYYSNSNSDLESGGWGALHA